MTDFSDIVSSAWFLLIPLALIFIGGQLLRADAARDGISKAPSRLRRDLRALENALVEFFAHSTTSSTILSMLVAQRSPATYNALVAKIRSGQERGYVGDDFPESAVRALLAILKMGGLVRMDRRGFAITDVGAEVHRRIDRSARLRPGRT